MAAQSAAQAVLRCEAAGRNALREPSDMEIEQEPVESPSAAAHYIASLSGELAQIARSHGLECLGYILDMARLEADQIAKGSAESNGHA
jgi:hypothetical protein